jgi:threonine synthase
MKFYSTNKESDLADFREATILGQAPDKGLYFPAEIPKTETALIRQISNYSNEEIAFRVIEPYVGKLIRDDKLYDIVSAAINFPVPLVKIDERISSLELFHGPTLAFKDVGARFMSRCLGHFVEKQDKEITVLVATSGDTGGAVANGFYEVEGVKVIILYPSGKVSPVQEKQLTTLGKNIRALEVNGSFDDCQQMVKKAFADKVVTKKHFLTSANSINIARWLPQQFYYFLAYKQWQDKEHPLVIAVPSGNFGNISAGVLAWRSGLPVKHFIAACNSNDAVLKYLEKGTYAAQPAIPTISNAMDVGDPSNFVRLLELFEQSFGDFKSQLSAYSISDKETLTAIEEVYEEFNYLTDPHGAVGFLALKKWLTDHPRDKGIFLETAHPVKFPNAIEPVIGKEIPVPSVLREMMQKPKESIRIGNTYEDLKGYLLGF